MSLVVLGGGQPHEPRRHAPREREAAGGGGGVSGGAPAQTGRSHDAEQSAEAPDSAGEEHEKREQEVDSSLVSFVYLHLSFYFSAEKTSMKAQTSIGDKLVCQCLTYLAKYTKHSKVFNILIGFEMLSFVKKFSIGVSSFNLVSHNSFFYDRLI